MRSYFRWATGGGWGHAAPEARHAQYINIIRKTNKVLYNPKI